METQEIPSFTTWRGEGAQTIQIPTKSNQPDISESRNNTIVQPSEPELQPKVLVQEGGVLNVA